MPIYLECSGQEMLGVPFWQSEFIAEVTSEELPELDHRVLFFLCMINRLPPPWLPKERVLFSHFLGASLNEPQESDLPNRRVQAQSCSWRLCLKRLWWFPVSTCFSTQALCILAKSCLKETLITTVPESGYYK